MTWRVFISGLVLSFLALLPLGLKWQIQKRVIILAALLIGMLSGTVVNGITSFWNLRLYHVLVLQVLVVAATSISLLLWRFYRDPERITPEDDNAIVSPADGKVIYVKKIVENSIPFSEKKGRTFPLSDFVHSGVFSKGGYLIGIMMNYLDVHINRAPIGGRITLLNHIKGLFISLKNERAVLQNERVFTIIDNGHFRVGIVQVASRLVRKIVPYVREGQEVQKGERIGMIRFGSQVDLILPDVPILHIVVSPGDKLKAGMSIIATLDLV
ncbi:MAG: phosphatidylserine decarboxylase [Candidatus Hodarchaeota archaeon]